MSAYKNLLENDWFWYEDRYSDRGKLLNLEEKKILMDVLPNKGKTRVHGICCYEIDKSARLFARQSPGELEFHLSPIAGEIYTRSFDYILDIYMKNHPGRFTKAARKA